MTEFYLKSVFVLAVLLLFLFLLNRYVERKRLLSASGLENLKVIPMGGSEKLIVFTYKGEEFLIFSNSHSALLLKRQERELP